MPTIFYLNKNMTNYIKVQVANPKILEGSYRLAPRQRFNTKLGLGEV